ncbi:MAG: lipopolysaccharide heptosyltransferase II [Betaproteobacteria bacterium]|nr:lipopolysaccharide heptosyltransferase II [Betaproteobacteria bacterium]
MSKILVIGAAWVGDAVLSQPLLSALQQREPGLEIHVLAPAWTHGVLQRMPEVAQVLDNPFKHGELALGARYRLGRALQASGYRQAVLLPNSLKSALIPWFARIPVRTGYVGELRQWLLNDARRLDRQALPLMVERFAALALPAATPLEKPVPQPRLVPDLKAQAATLARLGLALDQPVAVLCPGAEYGPAKRWPVRHFAEAARRFIAEGFQVWLLGSGKDRPVGEAIVAATPGPVHNLCGSTPLSEAVDLMAAAQRVISNDSGLMHVAAALDRPMAAVFGSSSPRFTPPLSPQAHVVSLNLSCSPCFKRECPLGHLRCLEELQPDQVMTFWKS